MTGTLNGFTASGQITFSGLNILSAGIFSIVATSSGIVSTTSTSATVTNLVSSITVTSNNASPSAFFEFMLTVNVIGQDQHAFTGSCTLLISTSPSSIGLNFIGSSSVTTTTGSATFNVYFNSFGSKVITGACNSITGTLTLTILEQALKITNINPTVINI